MTIHQDKMTGRVTDAALGSQQAKPLAVRGTARENQTPDQDQRHDLRTSSSAAPTELVRRLVDIALRLHALRDSDALYACVIDAAAHLSGAQRVLLVLSGPDGLRIAGSLVPQGEGC